MQFGAQVAGLDQCDLRLAYDEKFLTSTPSKSRICKKENLDCWEEEENLSRVPTYAPMISDSDESLNNTDNSYGGHWNKFPVDSLAMALAELDEPLEEVSEEEEEHIDETDMEEELSRFNSMILDMNEDEEEQEDVAMDDATRPHVDSLHLPLHRHSNPIRANLNRKYQVQFKLTKIKHSEPNKQGNLRETEERVKSSRRTPDDEQLMHEVHVLDQRVCHAKSKADPLKENDNDPKLTFRTENLKILVNNIRGWYGKRESLETITASESLDIIILCETFTTGKRYPEMKGYVTYFRNRPKRAMGGVAILIKEEKAKYVVKVEEGKGDNEYFAVMFSNCDPKLVIFVYYGAQSNTFGVDEKKLHISQLLEDAKKYLRKGHSVQILGDFNLHIGNQIVSKNHPDASATGKLFCDMIQNLGLHIMNGLSPNPITYIDRSGPYKRENVLDLVLTNEPNNIHDFKTDDTNYLFTPYSIKMKAGNAERTYADHMSIVFSFRTKWQDRVKLKREPVWGYKAPMGDLKFDLFTNNACHFLIKKVTQEKSIDAAHKAFKTVIKKAK